MPPDPTAAIHPGSILVVWDHGGLQLRDDAGELIYVSLYDYRFDLDDGPGHVCLVRYRGDGDAAIDLTVTDNEALCASHMWRRARMRSLSGGRIVPGRFSHTESRDQFAYQVEAAGIDLDLAWRDLGPPIFMTGHHPQTAEIEVFGHVRESVDPVARLNGVVIGGEAFPNEAYTPWLGRPLHSAVVTIGEVLIEGPGSAAGASWSPSSAAAGIEEKP